MRTRSQAKTPAEVAPVVCPNKSCGLTLSASLVKRTGKCIRCGAAVAAPAGTPDTDAARFAAEHAAKTQAAVPLGTRAPGMARPAGDVGPGLAPPTAAEAARNAPADDFGPSVAEEDVTRLAGDVEEEAAERAGDDSDPYADYDPFADPLALPADDPRDAPVRAPATSAAVHARNGRELPADLPLLSPEATETRVSVSPTLGERASLDQAAFHAHEKLPIRIAEPGRALEVRTVTVTWGEELFSPVQFNTFKVGPFSATLPLEPGESEDRAMVRAYEALRAFAEKERERKLQSFLAAQRAAGGKARG